MAGKVFVAGASGAVGRRLVPMLIAQGWRVVGLTRHKEKCAELAALGAEPVVGDVFDAACLEEAVTHARPDIVIHQLTDLPPGIDPAEMEEATARNARIRDEGTRNLVAAATAGHVQRFIAQSVAFAYADGPLPHREGDALAIEASGRAGISARGVASLERQVLTSPFEGVILRYGRLYGPGTGIAKAAGAAPVHVDAAAYAALLAADRGEAGIYNIAEDDGTVLSEKARHNLAWSADLRMGETPI